MGFAPRAPLGLRPEQPRDDGVRMSLLCRAMSR